MTTETKTNASETLINATHAEAMNANRILYKEIQELKEMIAALMLQPASQPAASGNPRQLDEEKGEELHTVGFYLVGQVKKNGGKYVLLYSLSEHFKNKVLKIYDGEFHRLPFTPDASAKLWTDKSTPERGEVDLIPVKPFEIVTAAGKDTPMGKMRILARVIEN